MTQEAVRVSAVSARLVRNDGYRGAEDDAGGGGHWPGI